MNYPTSSVWNSLAGICTTIGLLDFKQAQILFVQTQEAPYHGLWDWSYAVVYSYNLFLAIESLLIIVLCRLLVIVTQPSGILYARACISIQGACAILFPYSFDVERLQRARILTDGEGGQSDFKSIIILMNIGAEKSGELQLRKVVPNYSRTF